MTLDLEPVRPALTEVERLAAQLRAAQAAIPSLWRRWMDDPALYRRSCEEARRLAPQRFRHLLDPNLLRRLTPIVVLDTGEDAETVKPVEPAKRRQRKPSVASVIRQMKRAGIEIAGCEINPRDGTVRVITGKPVQMKADDDRNEWDTVQ